MSAIEGYQDDGITPNCLGGTGESVQTLIADMADAGAKNFHCATSPTEYCVAIGLASDNNSFICIDKMSTHVGSYIVCQDLTCLGPDDWFGPVPHASWYPFPPIGITPPPS